MVLRFILFVFLIIGAEPSFGFFPFLRCDGLGDSTVSPSYCRICFATQAESNSRLCSQAAFNQSPDIQLLTQNLEDSFGNNFDRLKRLPAEGFNVFKKPEQYTCSAGFNELQFVEKQLEYLNARRQGLLNQMARHNCGSDKNQQPAIERIPASSQQGD